MENVDATNNSDYFRIEVHNKELTQNVGLSISGMQITTINRIGTTIVTDMKKCKVISYNGSDNIDIQEGHVLDLSDEGDRWEGDVFNEQPFGWGVLYDSEGEKLYEGFRFGNMHVCYGIQYYPDIHIVEYEGMIYDDMRWGRGKHYGRNGNVISDGEWFNNYLLQKDVIYMNDSTFLHNKIERLEFGDNSCNGNEWGKLDFSIMPYLHFLKIGHNCFQCVSYFQLCNLSLLEEVHIGDVCCTTGYNRDVSTFHVENCEGVSSLSIGQGSFRNYKSCIIKDLSNLKTVAIGENGNENNCFSWASLEMKSKNMTNLLSIDLPSLSSISIGGSAFSFCEDVVFES